MEEFVKFLISPLVSDPSQISISRGENSVLVTVPQADMGRLIGRSGSVVKHLRALLRTYCKLHRQNPVFLNILTQTDSPRGQQ